MSAAKKVNESEESTQAEEDDRSADKRPGPSREKPPPAKISKSNYNKSNNTYSNRNNFKKNTNTRPYRNNAPPKTLNITEQSSGFGELLRKGGYEIQVTYTAVAEIAGAIYDGTRMYDHKYSPPDMTRDLYIHVNQFAVLMRHLYVRHKLAHTNEPQVPVLLAQISSLSTVPFHNVMADYLESIGLAECGGILAYPYHENLDTLIEDIGFKKMTRDEKQRLVFMEGNQGLPDVEDIIRWADINTYVQATNRVRNMTRSFRTTDWYDTKGKEHLFVSHYHNATEALDYGVCTGNMSLENLQLGAIFQFWTTEEIRDRGDFTQFPIRFKGGSFVRTRTIIDIIESKLGA